MSFLEKQDPNIQAVINQELARQRDKLEMIASENFVSQAVMEAQGSVLTNKYAEGYPYLITFCDYFIHYSKNIQYVKTYFYYQWTFIILENLLINDMMTGCFFHSVHNGNAKTVIIHTFC